MDLRWHQFNLMQLLLFQAFPIASRHAETDWSLVDQWQPCSECSSPLPVVDTDAVPRQQPIPKERDQIQAQGITAATRSPAATAGRQGNRPTKRRMTMKIFRRKPARCIGLLSAFVTILLCLYYISIGQPSNSPMSSKAAALASSRLHRQQQQNHASDRQHDEEMSLPLEPQTCAPLQVAQTDITTGAEFSKFEFQVGTVFGLFPYVHLMPVTSCLQPDWINSREFWDRDFETRFEAMRKNTSRPALKVIIVPHSHNDPGWLKTFVNYFESDSKMILNQIVSKLQEYKDMTFIWSEISILQMWWDQAHPSKQRVSEPQIFWNIIIDIVLITYLFKWIWVVCWNIYSW